MSKTRATATLLCGVFALAVSSAKDAAAESEGFYFDVHGGGMYVHDADNEFEEFGDFTIETSYDIGYSVGLSLGYDLGQFRIEGEISSRAADIDEGSGSGVFSGLSNVDGDVYAIAGMVNAYYDFDFGSLWRPYVGGGFGGAIVGFNDLEGDVGALTLTFADEDDDLVFAFQAAVGIGYHFNDNFTLYGGYRFFGTTPAQISDVGNNNLETEFYSHSAELGIRYTF